MFGKNKQELLDQKEQQERIEAIGEQLRGKINSKFQMSTFLAGFALTVLGIQLSVLWQWDKETIPLLLFLSISFMIVAIIFYIGALIKLDELTMPKRFWEENPELKENNLSKLAYLTDQNLWTLKNIMVYYWVKLTLRATYLTAASLGFMLLPYPIYELRVVPVNTSERWLIFMGLIIVALGALFYFLWIVQQKDRKFGELYRATD